MPFPKLLRGTEMLHKILAVAALATHAFPVVAQECNDAVLAVLYFLHNNLENIKFNDLAYKSASTSNFVCKNRTNLDDFGVMLSFQ